MCSAEMYAWNSTRSASACTLLACASNALYTRHPYILHPCILHPATYTHTPYTLHPHILHPYTLHPYTLHPTPIHPNPTTYTHTPWTRREAVLSGDVCVEQREVSQRLQKSLYELQRDPTRGDGPGHKKPLVGASQARSWSPWLVLGAILWVFVATNRQGLMKSTFEIPPRRALPGYGASRAAMLSITLATRPRETSKPAKELVRGFRPGTRVLLLKTCTPITTQMLRDMTCVEQFFLPVVS